MNLSMTTRLVTFLFCCSASPAIASQLWGSNVGGSSAIVLYPIEADTGGVAAPKSIGTGLIATSVEDLASNPSHQPSVVWAVRQSSAGNELISVNVLLETLLSYKLMNAPSPILSLAIDPTSGVFYGATTAALYRIAPDTGTTTLVGATAMPVDKALGFDLHGNLYGISNNKNLVAVNKSTGTTTLVAPLNIERMEDIAARPEDGVMFGLGYANYSLFRINLISGQITNVGSSLTRPGGIAFTNVPEPASAVVYLLTACSWIAARPQFNRRPSSPANRWNAPGRIESGSWSPG